VRYAVVGVCLLVFGLGKTVAAQNVQPAPHVRAESAEMRRFIADTANRSATVNALLEALNDSDVVVYVR
jgi:regulator of extracellular matrix RemA (YlzA/DUF370 family)